jgi:SdrD B-like domain
MRKTATSVLAIFMCALNLTTNAQISGTVFRDINGNGLVDVNPIEPGIQGITINVFNASDALVGTTTSIAGGTYSITPTSIAPFRVEFIIPAALNYYASSASGSIYGTAVRFITTATQANVNFALFQRGNFTNNTNPSLVGARILEGAFNGTYTAQPVVYKAKYLSTGNTVISTSFALPTGATQLATMAQVGTVYGLASQTSKGKVYAGAFHKRYAGFGPSGPSAIYQIDTAGTGSITGVIDLSTLTGTPNVAGADVHDFVARARAGGGTTVFDLGPAGVGFTSFSGVGTRSLGDIEISGDEKNLFVVNLLTKQIYSLDISTGVAASTTIQFTWAAPDATGAARHRPFGLKWYRGLLYIGSVDENGTNAYVHSFDPTLASPTFNLVLTVPLNYVRQSFIGNANTPATLANWKPWTTDPSIISPPFNGSEFGWAQAILSDIQFDALDNMILGFRDRWGDQTGYARRYLTTSTTDSYGTTAGELLRACMNAAGTGWIVEAGAGCATANGLVSSGPGGVTSPEHYEWDFFSQAATWDCTLAAGGGFHWETTQGALAQLPGSAVVLSTAMDPFSDFSSGYTRFTNADGRREGITTNSITGVPTTGGFAVTETGNYTTGYPLPNGSFGKANGMGDVELLGILPSIEIGNRIWKDTNGDGIQNAGEIGIAAVSVELVDGSGNPVDSDPATVGVQATFVTTDANGNWYLTSATGTDATGINYGVALLPNTNYKVRLAAGVTDDWDITANGGAGGPRAGQQLVGYSLTKTAAIGTGAANLSDNDAALVSAIPQVSITTGNYGQNNHNIDFGFKQLASLGYKIWLDDGTGGGIAQNGVQDGTEPGIAGVSVNLYQNGTDGLPGTNDDILVAATITDAYGNYLFDNLQPSAGATTQYNIKVTPVSNYIFTTQTNTTDDNNTSGASTTGSDVNVLGVSYSIDLSSGENNPNIGIGLILKPEAIPNSIGDKVWFDANADGINANDATEPAVAGVTVTLYDDATGNIVAITTTDANGNYIFNNLPANTSYKVGFSAPGGMLLSLSGGTLDIANGSTNSDPSPITGLTSTINTGIAGTQITGVDAGLQNDAKGAIGDFVWNDLNHDGVQDLGEPGVPGMTMQLYGPGIDGVIGGGDDVLISTVTTDPNGYYVFSNLNPAAYFVVATAPVGYSVSPANVANTGGITNDNNFSLGTAAYAGSLVSNLANLLPTVGGITRDMTIELSIYNNTANLNSLGDKVWNDVNKDGLQTAGEAGVANVTVRLLTSAGAAVNNPATGKPYVVVTDANGNYKFVDLIDGNYIVEFANIPVGYSFTGLDASGTGAPGSGTDGTNDSDAKTTTGRTGTISVDATNVSATSVNIITVDAGISQGIAAGTASLGNRVWYDVNGNDLQDATELGVGNVKVELLDALGAVVNVPSTAIPYVVYTNALGEYLFTGLPAGDYTVRFSRLPAGYTSSTANTGADDAIDADVNFAGISVTATTTATTAVYTLQTGEDNLTVDMGIVPAAGTNSVGNFVWNDLNADGLQTAGELGVQGVTVTLYTNGVDGLPGTADDVFVGVTTTDNNGAYSFVGLADGNYNIGFGNLPTGAKLTTQTVGTATGSDPNAASGRTGTIALDPTSISAIGINNADIDAGITTTTVALGNYVWLDTNGDGVQDATEKGVSGVTVILYDAIGTTVLASTITDANGKYFFGNLAAGSYVVGFSSIPSNLSFTQQNTAMETIQIVMQTLPQAKQ